MRVTGYTNVVQTLSLVLYQLLVNFPHHQDVRGGLVSSPFRRRQSSSSKRGSDLSVQAGSEAKNKKYRSADSENNFLKSDRVTRVIYRRYAVVPPPRLCRLRPRGSDSLFVPNFRLRRKLGTKKRQRTALPQAKRQGDQTTAYVLSFRIAICPSTRVFPRPDVLAAATAIWYTPEPYTVRGAILLRELYITEQEEQYL